MMPRDDIKALIARTALLTFEYNGTSTLDGDAVLKIIDAVYDDFESESNDFCRQLSEKETRIFELEQMIYNKGLKIMLVAKVSTKTAGSFNMTAVDETSLEEDLKLYDLELEDKEYMLLSVAEIKHIEQKGYLL